MSSEGCVVRGDVRVSVSESFFFRTERTGMYQCFQKYIKSLTAVMCVIHRFVFMCSYCYLFKSNE